MWSIKKLPKYFSRGLLETCSLKKISIVWLPKLFFFPSFFIIYIIYFCIDPNIILKSPLFFHTTTVFYIYICKYSRSFKVCLNKINFIYLNYLNIIIYIIFYMIFEGLKLLYFIFKYIQTYFVIGIC